MRDSYFMCYERQDYSHAIFLISLLFWPPLSSYSLNTRTWYVFLISIRIEFTSNLPVYLALSFDLPRDSFPRDKFAAQGPFRWNSIFAISNYRRNREAERISFSSFLLSIDLSFLYSLLAPRSAIVQPLPLNSISFVSFHVFCYVRSTCVNKMIVKLIRNWRTICEKSTHCKNRNIIFQSDEI